MALLVSDTRQEDFSKPPPKKKWLQEYIEQDSVESATKPPTITETLSTEAKEFVRLFDNGTNQVLNNNLKQLSEQNKSKGKITMSQEVIGGVVQGVLDQFQTFFEGGSPQGFSMVPSSEEQKLTRLLDPARTGHKFNESLRRLSAKPSEAGEGVGLEQEHITPVVQSVISQFLNGSLEDSDFRRRRKRSHHHMSCRHKGESSSSHGDSIRAKRSNSVIKYNSREATRKEEIKASDLMQDHNDDEALNLSLPKPVAKVTFDSQDWCYTTDFPTVKSFQPSKSEVINRETLELNSYSPPPVSPPHFPLPVIRHTSSRCSSPTSEEPIDMALVSHKQPESFLLSSSPRPSPPPLEAIQNPDPISIPSSSFAFPVIKPRPLAPLLEPSPRLQAFPAYPPLASPLDMAPRPPASSLVSRAARERLDSLSKEEIKRTSSSTREVHNRLEKNRRAHLKMCFDELALECDLDPKKTSNLTVIRSAYKFTMSLKRKERENERNMAGLVQDKIRLQQRLEELKRDFSGFKTESETD